MTQAQHTHRFDARSLLLLGALTLASGAGWAQGSPAPDDASSQALVAAFAKADQDGDGKLSPAEAARLPAVAERFAQLDKDGDGALSSTEFMTGLQSN